MNLPALVAQVEEVSKAPVLLLHEVLVSGGSHICFGTKEKSENGDASPKNWAVSIGDRFIRRDGLGLSANGILSSESDPFKVVVAHARFLGKVKSKEILRALVQGRGGINEIINSGCKLLYDGPESVIRERSFESMLRLDGKRTKEHGLEGARVHLAEDKQALTLIDRSGTFVIEARLHDQNGTVNVSFVDVVSEKLKPGNEITGVFGRMVAIRLISVADREQVP